MSSAPHHLPAAGGDPPALGSIPIGPPVLGEAAAAAAAALASLPGITPGRLRRLLAARPPVEAWALVASGDLRAEPSLATLAARHPRVIDRWLQHVSTSPPDQVAVRCAAAGASVTVIGHRGYPESLQSDAHAPAVLFSRGDLAVASKGRRVAVVGTRNATAAGRDIAVELGAGLAAAGVHVVSGLARGIDGCSHRGALSVQSDPGSAAPIAVVGTGIDVIYPKEHQQLWDAVAEAGVVLSEWPPGTGADPWRFPLRNRMIATLGELLVVVESRATGGSMLTVSEAERRGRDVLAVPGSTRSRASDGTNQLLSEGCPPARDVGDVLVALGLTPTPGSALAGGRRRPPEPVDRTVLALFGADALDLGDVARLAELALVEAALALGRLEAGGWLVRAGSWFEAAGTGGGRGG